MDLLFKNFPYFVEVYFNFSFFDYLLVFIPLVVVFIGIHSLHRGRLKNKRDLLMLLLFAAYFTTVICITLLNRSRKDVRQLLLNPINDIIALSGELGVHHLRGIVSNIIMFVPFGIFVSTSSEKQKIFVSCFRGLVCSIAIEAAQYVFQRGVTESIDVICNVMGTLIGVILVRMTNTLIKKTGRNDKEL